MVSCPIRNSSSTVKQMKELQVFRGKAIRACIEYVVCVPTLISFICLVPELDETVGISTPRTSQFREIDLLSGYWRNLYSRVDFMDKPLKSCVDVIHAGIVDLWNLNDANRVSSPHFPDFFNSLSGISICQVTNSR